MVRPDLEDGDDIRQREPHLTREQAFAKAAKETREGREARTRYAEAQGDTATVRMLRGMDRETA